MIVFMKSLATSGKFKHAWKRSMYIRKLRKEYPQNIRDINNIVGDGFS